MLSRQLRNNKQKQSGLSCRDDTVRNNERGREESTPSYICTHWLKSSTDIPSETRRDLKRGVYQFGWIKGGSGWKGEGATVREGVRERGLGLYRWESVCVWERGENRRRLRVLISNYNCLSQAHKQLLGTSVTAQSETTEKRSKRQHGVRGLPYSSLPHAALRFCSFFSLSTNRLTQQITQIKIQGAMMRVRILTL